MSAARIVTTTERFDEMGKLIERVTEEKFAEECKKKKEELENPRGMRLAQIHGWPIMFSGEFVW